MSDKLSQFTPATGSLDTAAMLFEAGRASMPSPWRGWAVASLLAMTQVLTLLAWVPGMADGQVSPQPAPPAATTPESHQPGPMHVRHLPEDAPADNLPPDQPPLRAIDISLLD